MATPTDSAISPSPNATATAITAEIRNAVVLVPPVHRPTTSCASTPDTAIVRPDDVDRNAANAPATISADNSSPAVPPTIRDGSSSTTRSVRPDATRSGAYRRPRAAYTGGST